MTLDEMQAICDQNRKDITEEATRDSGKFVIMQGSDKPALLLAAADGEDDFYWVIMESDLRLVLSTCVGGYDIIEGELPSELSVLKWLQDNDKNGLLERAMKGVNEWGEEIKLLTDIRVAI